MWQKVKVIIFCFAIITATAFVGLYIYETINSGNTIRILDESIESYKRDNTKLLKQITESRDSIDRLSESFERAGIESEELGITIERSTGILSDLRAENQKLRKILIRSESTSNGIKKDSSRIRDGIEEALQIIGDLRADYPGE